MQIDIVTIFPGLVAGFFEYGILHQAGKKGLLKFRAVDLRDFADDRHATVDDRPFGGGAGMVMKPEPIFRAVEFCRGEGAGPPPEGGADRGARVILLTPQGRLFDQAKAKELSLCRHLILICGRYEGVDQRVADHLAHEELSIGDYVLAGGELPALVVTEAVARLVAGVVGKAGSVLEDSFMEGLLDYPHYTRPAEFRGWKVPVVLLSGDHQRILKWREEQALKRTRERRPDLLKE